jgi:serine/threonine-protein kinase
MGQTPAGNSELAQLHRLAAGRYAVERELGRGGMGVVFLGRDVSLDRRVAIKLLSGEYASQDAVRQRFLREARLSARLSHPNIVPVYAVEEHPEALFYAMGYVEGESLAARIERVGQLAPSEVATIVQQVAWALAYAHGNGVVHRDIKPDNILIEQGTGRAWVLDFGIARALEGAAEQPQLTKLTQVGHVVGTAAYMSPEQAAGEDVDGRSDLYSLGVVAFQALTGRLPLEATSAQALLAKHLTETPPPVASVRPGVPPALAKVVDGLLAKNPAARPSTGEAVAEALAATNRAAADVPPALREFLRTVEQNFVVTIRFLAIILAVGIGKPSAAIPLVFGGLGTIAGSLGAIWFLARRLAAAGYRYPDIRDAVGLDAQMRTEEVRAIATVPARAAMRAAKVRAVVSLAVGIAIFIGAITVATRFRDSTMPYGFAIGLTVILLASLLLVGSVMPLAYYVAMQRSAKKVVGTAKPSPGLRILATGFGRWLFTLASRDLPPAAPRGAAAALDLLLSEVEAVVGAREKAIVRDLRARIEVLGTETLTLRARERELDRAIAEAGPGPTADQLADARRAIAPRVERIAAAVDAARLKLLLVRSGVAPASDLTPLAIVA